MPTIVYSTKDSAFQETQNINSPPFLSASFRSYLNSNPKLTTCKLLSTTKKHNNERIIFNKKVQLN